MRKIALATVAAVALPLAIPAMAQQNGANQNAPAQNQQQMQSSSQGSDQQSNQQLSRNEIQQVQRALDQKGFKAGRADGKIGPETQQALSSFQKSKNLQQTGQPDQQTLAALGINQSGTTGQGSSNQPMPSGQGGNQPSQNQKAPQGANGK